MLRRWFVLMCCRWFFHTAAVICSMRSETAKYRTAVIYLQSASTDCQNKQKSAREQFRLWSNQILLLLYSAVSITQCPFCLTQNSPLQLHATHLWMWMLLFCNFFRLKISVQFSCVVFVVLWHLEIDNVVASFSFSFYTCTRTLMNQSVYLSVCLYGGGGNGVQVWAKKNQNSFYFRHFFF